MYKNISHTRDSKKSINGERNYVLTRRRVRQLSSCQYTTAPEIGGDKQETKSTVTKHYIYINVFNIMHKGSTHTSLASHF